MPKVIANDGAPIYAETHGDGIPVIFSCAYCVTHENWRSQVEDLVAAGFQIILWDYRGHGKSATPDDIAAYSMEQVLDDLGCILDWAAGERPAVLAGHSFGGLASLHFALRHPDRVRALILIGTGPGFKNPKAAEGWMAQMERTAGFLEKKGFEAFVQKAATTIIGRQPDLPAAQGAAEAIIAQDPFAVARFGRRIAGPVKSVIDELPKIGCPALVLVGEEDIPWLKAAEVITAKLPRARKTILPGAAHILNIEATDAFNELVIGFLNTLA